MSLQPEEAELLRNVVSSFLKEAYFCLPARCVAYDPATQTGDFELVILNAEQAESGAIVHEEHPVIPNVPVGWHHGGGYSLQFRLTPGDHVWLVFNDAAIAQWRETGEVSKPGDLDRHDISYPWACPAARHSKGPLPQLPEGVDALLTVPEGGSLSVSEAGGTPGPVAMAEQVNANFQAIISLFSGWTPSPNDGGAALKTASASLSFDDVSSSTLKAES